MPVSSRRYAVSSKKKAICVTSHPVQIGDVFRDCEGELETPSKTFYFSKLLFICFLNKTFKLCWLQLVHQPESCFIRILVLVPAGKKWVWLLKAATVLHFDNFSFSSVWAQKTISAFFSRHSSFQWLSTPLKTAESILPSLMLVLIPILTVF